MSIFNKVSREKLPSNLFKDLSYSNKYDMQIGYLYPCHVEEIVPGDIFFGGHGAMVRSQAMVSPVMHNFNYTIRWFFVPNRIVWDNFESFITDQEKGKKTPGLSEPHVHPYLAAKTQKPNMLHDMLGLSPIDGVTYGNQSISFYSQRLDLPPNALPYRGYNLIWNEYFKDENTMDDAQVLKTDGADDTEFELLRVSWKKDYFTSALPWAQRGDEVQLIGRAILANTDKKQLFVNSDGDPLEYPGTGVFGVNADGTTSLNSHDASHDEAAWLDPNDTIGVELSFNAIRRANALQKFLERSALGGNRYAELLLAHFGVRSSDQSLQRPQYLGGGVAPINISPVEQTSGTTESSLTPQGNLAGKGVGVGSMYMNKPTLFTEHGWLIGVCFIRPDADYCQGISRHMVKRDRFDYYWPDFQNIGEQEIKNYELFISQDADEVTGSFGYQSRYAEYKWHGNEVHGEFRNTLRSWVAPRTFSEQPTLSKEFIECDLDISNNMAVSPSEYPPFMVEAMNVVNARRPMYYFNRGTL